MKKVLPANQEVLSKLNQLRIKVNSGKTINSLGLVSKSLLDYQMVTLQRGIKVIEKIKSNEIQTSNINFLLDAVLIKPVSDECNLQCTYCYQGIDQERINGKMSLTTLETVLREVLSMKHGKLSFAWHGGEPLLRGLDFYKKAMEYQRKYNIHNINISNSIQTNGILINQDWIDFFKKENFVIGISLDGNISQHDFYRVDKQGKGSYEKVAESISALINNNLIPNCITVINSTHIGKAKEFFNSILSLGLKKFDIHPSFGFNGPNDKTNIAIKDYCEFMYEIFQLWINKNDYSVRIRVFDEFFKTFIGEKSDICYYSGTCSKIIAFNADGVAIPCTRPFDNEWQFGNILENPLKEILVSEKWKLFKLFEKKGQQYSKDCKWENICFGGCPQHRYKNGKQDITSINYLCNCESNDNDGIGLLWQKLFDETCQQIDKSLIVA